MDMWKAFTTMDPIITTTNYTVPAVSTHICVFCVFCVFVCVFVCVFCVVEELLVVVYIMCPLNFSCSDVRC